MSTSGYSEYVDRIDRFMNYYKGKVSFSEVLEMPNRLFHRLYVSLLKKLSTEEGQKEIAEQEVVEKIEEEVVR